VTGELADTATDSRPLTRGLILTLAAATGISAANLYYAQPLLHTIAQRFGASVGQAGLVVTASQIGYAAGLAFLVPAGDLFDRKLLVPRLLFGAAALLAVAAAAPTLFVLVAVMGLVGTCVVVAQILVPLVAELATDGQRGRAVGSVMTGLLLGILLARTVSGIVAGLAGWRTVFVLAAVATAALAVVLRTQLPHERPRPHLPYREIMRTTLGLGRDEPELRRSAVLGALVFASFSVFWTTIAFLLSARPFGYGDSAIGLLGLAGAAGALCATVAGRLADRGLTRIGRIGAAASIAGAFGLLWLGRTSIVVIVIGVLVLDIGVQGVQVLNQSTVYELVPGARSRINGVYMTTYFIGGALGSAGGAFAFDHGGWRAVCVLGAALGLAAVTQAARPSRVPRVARAAGNAAET
jgi:predicted MFS family arabinose efflux permease